jgi:hypothetical protein
MLYRAQRSPAFFKGMGSNRRANQLLTLRMKAPISFRMSSSITELSAQQLRHAAGIKEKIQSLENELQRILGSPAKFVSDGAPKKNYKMSAAARAKISAAAKARWAKVNGAKPIVASASKPKRTMSAAARAKIAAAAKARWAKIKAAKS